MLSLGLKQWKAGVEDKTKHITNLTLVLMNASISNRGAEKFNLQIRYHYQSCDTTNYRVSVYNLKGERSTKNNVERILQCHDNDLRVRENSKEEM